MLQHLPPKITRHVMVTHFHPSLLEFQRHPTTWGGVLQHLAGPAADDDGAARQGRTLVHYSAQLESFLTQKHILNTPNTP